MRWKLEWLDRFRLMETVCLVRVLHAAREEIIVNEIMDGMIRGVHGHCIIDRITSYIAVTVVHRIVLIIMLSGLHRILERKCLIPGLMISWRVLVCEEIGSMMVSC